jgi:hypothetical protein
MKLPKFNLRDLIWLVVVVAMGVGWWIDRTRQQQRIDALEADAKLWSGLDQRFRLLGPRKQ